MENVMYLSAKILTRKIKNVVCSYTAIIRQLNDYIIAANDQIDNYNFDGIIILHATTNPFIDTCKVNSAILAREFLKNLNLEIKLLRDHYLTYRDSTFAVGFMRQKVIDRIKQIFYLLDGLIRIIGRCRTAIPIAEAIEEIEGTNVFHFLELIDWSFYRSVSEVWNELFIFFTEHGIDKPSAYNLRDLSGEAICTDRDILNVINYSRRNHFLAAF